ncbi:MAG: hypothetical protein KGI14_07070 [Acidobacteriota bacterium]|nr:hypothetical protein [Acidobacteriota bacterium]
MTTAARTLATLEGYAVEGGFDVRFGPATCYAPTTALKRHAATGDAMELWRDYEVVVEHAARLGLGGLCVTLEWARLAPERDIFDEAAARRYEALLREARRVGLWTTVVVVDAVWPAWAGLEAWLLPWVQPVFVEHAQRLLERFDEVTNAVIPFRDAQALIQRGFVDATAPPWRRRASADARDALANVQGLEQRVRDLHPTKMVRAYRALDADGSAAQLRAARADASLDEVHLRSLVRGVGPTAAKAGLLARDGASWRVEASEELVLAWR